MLSNVLFCLFMLVVFTLTVACDNSSSDTVSDGDTDLEGEFEELEPEIDGDMDLDPVEDDLVELDELAEAQEDESGEFEELTETEEEKEIEEEVIPTGCNGFDSLCNKPFNEVAYATTHNAMSNAEDNWNVFNQYFPMKKQMEDGIRAMMLDTYYDDSVSDGDIDDEQENPAYLCHGSCLLGKLLLSDGLKIIADFLAANPKEVMTLIFESYISAESAKESFVESGLINYVYSHDADIGWPTLQEMIDSGQRVVVLTDREGGAFPWYHKMWDYCFDTKWQNSEQTDFNCNVSRGSADNDLFILNHFLYSELGLASYLKAEEANHNPFFVDRAELCRNERGHIPNFVTVDFYSIGDIFEVVNSLNGTMLE